MKSNHEVIHVLGEDSSLFGEKLQKHPIPRLISPGKLVERDRFWESIRFTQLVDIYSIKRCYLLHTKIKQNNQLESVYRSPDIAQQHLQNQRNLTCGINCYQNVWGMFLTGYVEHMIDIWQSKMESTVKPVEYLHS